MNTKTFECCILGAGPAGLGAALELVQNGVSDTVIVDRNRTVGGLARTEVFNGTRFDIGPHRFFTKNAEVNDIWRRTLGTDFKSVQRLTRIYYKQKYFNYPIKAIDAVSKLGLVESLHAILSYVASRARSSQDSNNFEDWIIRKFGRKLYEVFFKTYTEKIWGIPCREISAEWAAQRIKGLDIVQVIKSAIISGGKKPKTLVEEFDYPVLGAGQMYEAMAEKVSGNGMTLMLNTTVLAVNHQNRKIKSIYVKDRDGNEYDLQARQYFSCLPLTHFSKMLRPAENDTILTAADSLYYRDHITVNLLVDGGEHFPDQWIYIHSPEVQMARLANYNNFSKAMVGHKGKSALSVEYFVFKHEPLWQKSDEEIKQLAIEELKRLNLISKECVDQAWVVRETESYPTYYLGFQEPYQVLIDRIVQFDNLYSIGRGGMYKYNNQDHSLFSGMLAARNYLHLPGSPYNLWDINIDAEYHESSKRSS